VIYNGLRQVETPFRNTGLYNIGGSGAFPFPNQGLFSFTEAAPDMGKFRAPSLRNIAVTAPYMHDGTMATLEEVLDFYAAGGRVIADGPLAGDYGGYHGDGGEWAGLAGAGHRAGSRRILPKGYTRSDERLREDVCERLAHSGLDVSDVSVSVTDGQVELSGTVARRRDKYAIENCADDCLGVADIDNRIRVVAPTNAP